MAAGDLVVADDQFEWGGVLFGVGTSMRVVTLEGLDTPAIRNHDLDLAHADGAWPGRDFWAPRQIVAHVEVIGASNLAAIRAAMVRASGEAPWVFRGYLRGSTKLRTYAKPAGFRYRYDRRARIGGVIAAELRWVCPDPLVYSDAETTTAFAAGATHSITNAGDQPSRRWEFTFSPSSTGAKAAHASGVALDLDGYAISGTAVVADARALTVLQGTTNRFDKLTAASDFFELAAGAQNVTYTTDSGTGAGSLAHRSAFS